MIVMMASWISSASSLSARAISPSAESRIRAAASSAVARIAASSRNVLRSIVISAATDGVLWTLSVLARRRTGRLALVPPTWLMKIPSDDLLILWAALRGLAKYRIDFGF